MHVGCRHATILLHFALRDDRAHRAPRTAPKFAAGPGKVQGSGLFTGPLHLSRARGPEARAGYALAMTTPEDVFAGPAMEMPAGPVSKPAVISFRSVEGDDGLPVAQPGADSSLPPQFGPAAVRHSAGYAPFLAYLQEHEGDPRPLALALAASPRRLLRYLRAHAPAVLADPELRGAAEVFLGNCIATLRADAVWRSDETGPHEVGAGRFGFVPASILSRLVDSGETADDVDADVDEVVDSLNGWVEEADDDALPPPPLPSPVPPASGTPPYVRPELPCVEILDETGRPIPYGSRWGWDGPPEGSYSVEAHPERFAGLHTVARALIEHLERVFDVDVIDEPATDAALLRPQRDVIARVRVLPRDSEAAPLLVAFTAYPGVIVEAGVLHAFPYPICGCEACDETADAQATELEELVFAVTLGGYAEHYPVGRRRDLHLGLVHLDVAGAVTGSSWGSGDTGGLSAERLERGEATLAALHRGWQPWPLRRGEVYPVDGRDPRRERADPTAGPTP